METQTFAPGLPQIPLTQHAADKSYYLPQKTIPFSRFPFLTNGTFIHLVPKPET